MGVVSLLALMSIMLLGTVAGVAAAGETSWFSTEIIQMVQTSFLAMAVVALATGLVVPYRLVKTMATDPRDARIEAQEKAYNRELELRAELTRLQAEALHAQQQATEALTGLVRELMMSELRKGQ